MIQLRRRHIRGKLDRVKPGKDRNQNVGFGNRKRLILAGLGLLCLLAGCAQKEPGQAEYGAEDLKETSSVETGGKNTLPVEMSIEGNSATEPPIKGKLPTGLQGSPAGGEERKLRVEVSLESDSPEAEYYEAFLKGKCEATLSEQYYSVISRRDPVPVGQESFSFQEMLDTIVSSIREDAALDGMERVECALVDCGSDGRSELAVRACGVGIWGGRDEGNGEVIMIFRLRDGRVELIYSLDCWARSYADIYSNGYVAGGSSAGIMDQYLWYGIIGADGVYRQYSLFIEMEQGLPGMTDYKAVQDETLPAEFYECTLGDEKMYGYYIWEDIPEDVRENVMAYIAENEEKMGVKFLPYEEMDKQLDRWAESLGITEEMRKHGLRGITWRTVGGCEDYLCGQQN